jgi:hypothetical protein
MAATILRLEDAPDPILEEDPKVNPVFTSATAIVATAYWPSAGWLIQAESQVPAWDPWKPLGALAGSMSWIPLSIPTWWQIIYPNPVRLTSFHLGTSTGTAQWATRIPRDWTWQGSNDGATWTTIGTFNKSDWGSSPQGTITVFDMPDIEEYYTYWRMNITTTNGAADVVITAEQFFLYTAQPAA